MCQLSLTLVISHYLESKLMFQSIRAGFSATKQLEHTVLMKKQLDKY